jgi:hypothetical protein
MKKLNDLTFEQFRHIQNNGYSLDVLYLLTLVQKGMDVKASCEDSVKLKALYQTLYRKGLVTEEGSLTLIGGQLLNFVDEDAPAEKIVKKLVTDSDFDIWWKTYPGTDTFTYRGVSFSGSRGLRKDKEQCKLKFDKILNEAEHTAKDLIAALEYEVMQNKENSIKNKSNKLTYMQNSLTYLNQRTFEPFIELIKEGNTIVKQTIVSGGTDI